ncbi:MAG: hypothetical protein ABIG28_00830 [archaeon]
MAIEEVINTTTNTATDLATALGSIGLWLKAVGIIAIVWVVAHIANWIFNRKKLKTLYALKEDLSRIEKKIDKLSKKLS